MKYRFIVPIILLMMGAVLSIGCSGQSEDAPRIYDITFDPPGPVAPNTDVKVTADVSGSNLEFQWIVDGGLIREAEAHSGQASGMPRIGVTPVGQDNVGEILDGLGLDYTEISLTEASSSLFLNIYDAVFINSSDAISVAGTEIGLKNWVDNGGSLYLSGKAGAYIPALGIDSVTFPKPDPYVGSANSGSDTIYGSVSEGVMAVETGISLVNLQLPEYEWSPIIDYTSPMKILIKADASFAVDFDLIENLPPGEFLKEMPAAVEIPLGDGQIIYTMFHNQNGIGANENELLEYIAKKIICRPLVLTNHELINLTGYFPHTDFPEIIQEDGEKTWEYKLNDLDDILFVLNAAGGVFDIVVEGPGGINKSVSSAAPVSMTFPGIVDGTWSVSVTAKDLNDLTSVPLVLSVGGRSSNVSLVTQVPEVIWRTPIVKDIYSIRLRIIDDKFRVDEFTAGIIVE